jgi:hypothetical protein
MLEWINENLELVLGSTGIAAFVTYVSVRFTSVAIPRFLGQVQKTFAIIISNLFGVEFGEGTDMVNKLPVIGKFDEMAEELELQLYLKLLDLKKQLVSPLYTELEKVPIENLYNYLYDRLKDNLPDEFQQVLDQLDQIEAGE